MTEGAIGFRSIFKKITRTILKYVSRSTEYRVDRLRLTFPPIAVNANLRSGTRHRFQSRSPKAPRSASFAHVKSFCLRKRTSGRGGGRCGGGKGSPGTSRRPWTSQRRHGREIQSKSKGWDVSERESKRARLSPWDSSWPASVSRRIDR